MLIRFSVKNFRSFRTEQILSMEAGRQTAGTNGRTFESGVRVAPRLLHGAVIYSANSAGKTNLILAMDFFRDFVKDSAKGNPDDVIEVEPYRLDPRCINEPSQFEAVFVVDGTVYQYGFAVDKKRVHAEWLYETPQDGRIRHIFNREFSSKDESTDWYINPRLRGERKTWQEATRANALFLSVAVQLNSFELSKPFDWIKNQFRILLGQHFMGGQFTSSLCKETDEKSSVLKMLQSVDLGVVDFQIDESDWDENSLSMMLPDEIRDDLLKAMKGSKIYHTELIRLGRDGSKVKFQLDEESTGTTILYNLAGPWLDTLRNGYTLVIDELDSGIHPLVLRSLVNMFFDKTKNTSNAQLIITCHEATLLTDDLLRPDQVWFIDRQEIDGSRLYPLSEFKPRKNESYLRGYLGGRYGGIPLPPSIY